MKKIILSMGISLFVLATVASARGADEVRRGWEAVGR